MDAVGFEAGTPVAGKAEPDVGTVTVQMRNADSSKTAPCDFDSRSSRFSCPTTGLQPGVWQVLASNNADGELMELSSYVAVGAGKDYTPALYSEATQKDGRIVAKSVGDVAWKLEGWHPHDHLTLSFSPRSTETGFVTGPAQLTVDVTTDARGRATATADGPLGVGRWQVDATDGMWSMAKHNGFSPSLDVTG